MEGKTLRTWAMNTPLRTNIHQIVEHFIKMWPAASGLVQCRPKPRALFLIHIKKKITERNMRKKILRAFEGKANFRRAI